MDYWWTKDPTGQFVDGHECEDVMYCQMQFLPAWAILEPKMCSWTEEKIEVPPILLQECQTVVWHHDVMPMTIEMSVGCTQTTL